MRASADRLDQILDSAIAQERTDLSVAAPEPLPEAVEQRVRQALQLFAEGYYTRCQVLVRNVLPVAGADPRVAALDAACLALASGRLKPAMETCIRLLEHRTCLPDLYSILGVLLLKSRQRAEAYAVFRSGLRLAPHHRVLTAGLERMGVRRPPLLPFLPRSHPANRWLGRMLSWLKT